MSKLSESEFNLLLDSGYSKKAIDLFLNNVNAGSLEKPSLITTFLGPCGDLLKLYLRINDDGVIEKARFNCLGCIGANASASAMTTLIKGLTINQAKNLTEADIIKELEGLPDSKFDCVKLSIRALQKAIAEYEKLTNRTGQIPNFFKKTKKGRFE
ncbi:MAG: iron-sulfur cluster assembly scaffold protein [Crenarchaeota archaeon]|nr:iron-sulfur cluster assembly scaffold protein [Thermoproteota archaeon]